MRSMETDHLMTPTGRSARAERRRFLALLLALGVAPSIGAAQDKKLLSSASVLAGGKVDSKAGGNTLYLAARKREGRYEAVVLDTFGADQHIVPLPDRGHSFAIDAQRGRAVAFGRQPGFFATALDLHGRRPAQPVPLAQGRHFFGHGVYSADGNLLFATENDFEAGQGVLGVYDASPTGAYRRVGEFSSGGIGPHEVILMPDGKTLCVANGGILTHPDYGKLELNLDTMKPSLAYLDAQSGQLLEQVFLPQELHRLSLRHITLDASGAVWVGCQYMGAAADRPALVARHQRGQTIQLFSGPPEVLRDMRNYVGSVAADSAGRIIATSSPVGNRVVFWDAMAKRCLGWLGLEDGCGVAPAAGDGFMLSSGLGVLAKVTAASTAAATANFEAAGGQPSQAKAQSYELSGSLTVMARNSGTAWDNHMRIVKVG